ncbi:hypothetical protein PIB30_039732 [Stylosanthes scabra]|uniref:Uncharacterized protein n=1 Tax=Stylosanthes scabra TaxID=79078 RepID=A0ABU6SEN5_9FABA|nr:hypothetical protein [Stylosanthes scabra]
MVVDGELVVDVVDGSRDVERLCLDARWCDQESRVHIEFGVQGSESTLCSRFHKLPRIKSSRLVPEPIRFHSDFKFNVQNALRIDSSSSESILMRIVLAFKEDQSSAYGNSGPSGVVSTVESLFPRGTKANVAAYGSGRGPPAIVSATNLGDVTLPLIKLRRLSVNGGLQAGHVSLVALLPVFHLPPVLLRLLVDLPIQQGDVLPRVRSTASRGIFWIH